MFAVCSARRGFRVSRDRDTSRFPTPASLPLASVEAQHACIYQTRPSIVHTGRSATPVRRPQHTPAFRTHRSSANEACFSNNAGPSLRLPRPRAPNCSSPSDGRTRQIHVSYDAQPRRARSTYRVPKSILLVEQATPQQVCGVPGAPSRLFVPASMHVHLPDSNRTLLFLLRWSHEL